MQQFHQTTRGRTADREGRRGIITVLTGFCLTILFAFVALSVDTGRIVLTETQMQNAVDAAALAAATEINEAVKIAGQGGGSASIDANSIAVEAAKQMAALVAEANGVYVDAETDVQFGKRKFDSATGSWPIEWDSAPYNVVRVTARRTESDITLPDGELPLAFGWAVNRSHVPIQTSATAFLEARDLVVVLDFSGSMNDDSCLRSINSLGQAQVEQSLDGMWDALIEADPKWPGTNQSKFLENGFGDLDSYEGMHINSSDTDYIYAVLDFSEKYSNGQLKYPFPQAGRHSSGQPKSKPNENTSRTRWREYINYVKNLKGPYKRKYGYRTLMDYLQEKRYSASHSEDLWRTPHYPFHAIKDGTTLFLDFLEEIDFGDEVGLVSYGAYAVQEMTHNDGEVSIDITENPITAEYDTVNEIQRRHQAGHYNAWTGMGDGILKARELLVGVADDEEDEGHVRYGARPTMLIMTDGQTNQGPSGWSMPAGFSWVDWTDYDGDGSADYSTSDWKKQYSFYEATEAAKRGITLHTLAVGSGADRSLMRAIAFAGGGIFIDVPGGSTVAEMESQLIDAFRNIGSQIPPAKLVFEMSSPQTE
ncbi:MAG: pilus assembly protein TadG-related protein [Planctomycetota bacterium]